MVNRRRHEQFQMKNTLFQLPPVISSKRMKYRFNLQP
jgi:hypothetical protein